MSRQTNPHKKEYIFTVYLWLHYIASNAFHWRVDVCPERTAGGGCCWWLLHRLEWFQEARVTISSALKSPRLHSNMCNPCVISLRDRKHRVPPLISTPRLTERPADCFACRANTPPPPPSWLTGSRLTWKPGLVFFFWLVKRLTEKSNWHRAVRFAHLIYSKEFRSALRTVFGQRNYFFHFWRMQNHPSFLGSKYRVIQH